MLGLKTVANIIKSRVIDWLPNIFDWLFGIQRSNDLILTRAHFIRRQDANFPLENEEIKKLMNGNRPKIIVEKSNLPSSHLLLVNGNSLRDVIHL